jgi:hypothetical protein
MDIMLTVSYSLKIPSDEFFCSETGYIKEEMQEQLQKLFPNEMTLTENAVAKREHLIHSPLYENKNSMRCVSCGKWLYMPNKEHLQVSLEYCKVVKGIPLCPSCAWELEYDLKNEEFVRELKEKRYKDSENTIQKKE